MLELMMLSTFCLRMENAVISAHRIYSMLGNETL
jgi:hypothetical protein